MSGIRNRSLTGALGLSLFIMTPNAEAIRVRHDVPISAYNQLAAQEHLTAVGFVHAANMGCTGALVAPNVVLTAAHCLVDSNGNQIPPSQVTFRIDRPNGQSRTYLAQYVDIHPDWDRQRDKLTDIALITLTEEEEDVTPLRITTANPHERMGTLVGYGTQGTGNDPTSNTSIPGANAKLAAHNVIDRVRQECCNHGNVVIHVDFDQPGRRKTSSLGDNRPVALEGGASFGDSGSPLLARFGENDFIVGVASYIYGQGSPGPTGYGEVAGYQWVGSGEVETWLEMMGVELIHDPFAVPTPVADDDEPESPQSEQPGDMNNDDRVTPRDAAAFLVAMQNRDAAADLNNDGRADVRDAAVMLESLGFRPSAYPKKRQWKRAVRDFFRNSVEAHLVGYSKRERKQAEKILKQAHRFVTG